MDWASRHVLSWRVSNTMDSAFCVEALDAAVRSGVRGSSNTDQGAQFTGIAFTEGYMAANADGDRRCAQRYHLRGDPPIGVDDLPAFQSPV